MALKLKLTKEEHTALADPLKEHYKEHDGAFVLEGLADAATVKQFRDSATAAQRERDALKERYKDLDPDAARQAMQELERRRREPDDWEARLEARVKPLTTRIQTLEQDKANLQRDKEATHFHTTIETAARKAGVIPDHVEDVVARASSFGFKVVDGGNLRALRGDDPIRDEKTGAEMTVESWMKGLPNTFFGRTSGSGPNTGGSGSAGNAPVAGVLYNPDGITFSKHAEEIAKGTLRVVRS